MMFVDICKHRYYYNVMDSRLHQHVEKGKNDGLNISCVASASNLWAIVMDAGTGFTSQVYELSPVFLHKVTFFFLFFFSIYNINILYFYVCLLKEWIMEQWEKNYYITSLAGATNGSALVVMSKGKFSFL